MLFLPLLSFTPLIDLDHRVARLPDVVKEVAAEGGLKLAVAKELASELVYVRAEPRAAADWLPLLAEAACAEWEQDGATLRLTRSPGLKRRLEAREIAMRAERFGQSGRESVGAPEVKPLDAPGTQRLIADVKAAMANARARVPGAMPKLDALIADLLPSRRFLRRMLTPSVMAAFAAVPPGEVAYFSTSPTSRWRPLPVPVVTVQRYQEERSRLVAAIAASQGDRSFRTAVADVSDVLNLDEAPHPVAQVRIRAVRHAVNFMMLDVTLIDTEGNVFDTINPAFILREPRSIWPNPTRLQAATLRKTPRLEAIRLSSRLDLEPDPELSSLLSDPVKNDPGDVFLRPILDEICETSGTQAVIGLPDDAIVPIAEAVRTPVTLAHLALMLEGGISLRTRDGLLVGCPRYPIEATRLRTDREVLGGFIRTLRKDGALRLDAFAEYAGRQSPDSGASRLESLTLVASGACSPMNTLFQTLEGNTIGHRDTLRLYGQLPTAARRLLWKGDAIPFHRLPAPARETLEKRLFRRDTRFYLSQFDPRRNTGFAPDLLPDGIPGDGLLSARPEVRPGVLLRDGGRRGTTILMEDLGYALFRQGIGDPVDEPGGYGDLYKIAMEPIRHGNLNLRMHFSSEISLETMMVDCERLGPATRFADLPEGHRQVTQKAAEGYRQQHERTRNFVPPPLKTPPPSR